MIQLKSKVKAKDGFPAEFAILVEPDPWPKLKSDLELYTAVEKHGFAIVQRYEERGVKLTNVQTKMNPLEFELYWQGD